MAGSFCSVGKWAKGMNWSGGTTSTPVSLAAPRSKSPSVESHNLKSCFIFSLTT
jgi:hypothetical protein